MFGGKRPRPIPIAATEAYWHAAAEGRLVLPQAPDGSWEPSPRPGRRSDQSWQECSTTGVVHTFAVSHYSPYEDVPPPFVVALVQLDDGPRVTTNIVDADPDSIAIGMRVEVTFIDLDERRLPVFRAAA